MEKCSEKVEDVISTMAEIGLKALESTVEQVKEELKQEKRECELLWMLLKLIISIYQSNEEDLANNNSGNNGGKDAHFLLQADGEPIDTYDVMLDKC